MFVSILLTTLCVTALVVRGSNMDQLRINANSQSDFALTLQPNFDKWQRLLIPAPTAISLLGEMTVISSKIDVSLTSVTPIGGWKHVVHPESLRASLLQIGHEGWSSFRIAQRNMDEVQLNMAMVPRHVKTALRIIERMPPAIVARTLPKALNRIGASASLCERLANNTETVFVEVMDLVGEIEGAVASTSGVVEKNITVNKVRLTYANVSRTELKKQQALSKQRYDKIEREMDQARKAYEDAVDDIPTGFKAIAMDLCKVFVGVVKDVVGKFTGGGSGGGGGGQGGSGGGAGGEQGARVTDTIMLNMAKELQKQVVGLPQTVQDLADGNANADSMTALKIMAGQFLTNVAGYANTAIKQKVQSVYGEVKKLAEQLAEAAQDIRDKDQATIDEFAATAKQLVNQGNVLVSAAAASGADVRGDASANAPANYRNEYHIVNLRLQQLQTAERRSDETFQRLMAIGQQMAQVEAEIAALDITRINLKDILKMLKQVILLLGQMREQWSYLIQFFADVAVRAKTINGQVVMPFLSDASDFAQDLREEDRMIVLQMIAEMASDVETASFFLQEIAGTYVKISSKYLLGPLAGLGKMLAATTDAERQQLRQKLYIDRDDAKQGIVAEIERVRSSYKGRLRERQDDLAAYGRAMGLPASAEQTSQQMIEEGALLANSLGRPIY